MAKKEYACLECDTNFTIKSDSRDPVLWCPFCGATLDSEEANDFEDEDQE